MAVGNVENIVAQTTSRLEAFRSAVRSQPERAVNLTPERINSPETLIAKEQARQLQSQTNSLKRKVSFSQTPSLVPRADSYEISNSFNVIPMIFMVIFILALLFSIIFLGPFAIVMAIFVMLMGMLFSMLNKP